MSAKKYFGEVVKEGKRVRWPKRETIIPLIVVVVIITAISALILNLEDLAAARLLGAVEDAFKAIKG
ncbi:MAG: preprotein translocase subunit SecE [Bacilli bacterium]|jgi:preprotein translocase SecE subunit|nr:preprotein translocase subunit SecE [Bacilli bacterium]HML99751.1 preprotein translocase subunit SecE [Bacilli bacterium]